MADVPSPERIQAPPWLREQVLGIEQRATLDPLAERLRVVAEPFAGGRLGQVLRGEWLGHALHPLMTDLPLGCYLGSGLLDLFGGSTARPASRRLIGLGLSFAVPTALTGLVDWCRSSDSRVRRVGVAHAALNGAMVATYGASWVVRGRGAHRLGVALGLLGGGLGWASGYLGGHLSFNLGSGTGDRGLRRS